MTGAPAQAGNRTSKTAQCSQWWDGRPEWGVDASAAGNQHDYSFFWDGTAGAGPAQVIDVFHAWRELPGFCSLRFGVQLAEPVVERGKLSHVPGKTWWSQWCLASRVADVPL